MFSTTSSVKPPKKSVALLSQHYDKLSDATYEKFAEELGVERQTFYLWKKGTSQIPVNKVGSLTRMLGIHGEQAAEFITAVNPDITAHVNNQWLQEKIAQENWHHIDFPALDSEWLTAQPEIKQAGLLLRAFRERKGLSQEQLGQILHTKHAIISMWESGARSLTHTRLDQCIATLDLNRSETKRFCDTLDVSRLARKMAMAQTSLGATLPASEARDLLPEPDKGAER